METTKNKNQNGQSVLEVLLAGALFVIVATPLIGILLQSLQVGRISNDDVIAAQYATEGLDAVRDIRNQSYATLTASAGEGVATTSGTWGFAGTSTTLFGKFTRVITVSSTYRDGSGNIVASGGTLDTKTMKVTSAVTWSGPHSVTLSTYLTNWRASYGGSGGYAHYRAITVTANTSIASGTQSNFPMLVSSTLVSWEPTVTTSTGRIQNVCTAPNGGQEPCDLIYSLSSACTSPLNFETESYSSSTGALVDWVNVPSLSASTTIYACYGNSSILADQSHPSTTWNNYVSVYHFPNGTTLSTADSAANANTLTTYNNPTAVSGLIGGAMNTAGSSHQYASSTAASFDLGGSWTVSAWVNPASLPTISNYQIILGRADTNAADDNYFLLDSAGGFGDSSGPGFMILYDGASIPNTLLKNTTAPTIGNWYHVVGVWDASAHAFWFYQNGVVIASSTQVGNSPVDGAGGDFEVGDYALSQAWDGKIDEVRVSSAARSASWILTEYNNQSNPGTFYTVGSEN